MKKKIIAILACIHIFCFTTVNCAVVPVFGAPVATEILFNGLMTLLFSLGVTLDITNVTKETANDMMENYIEDAIGDDSTLQQQYQTFKDNLQYGYILLGRDLYLAILNYNYDAIISPSNVLENFPDSFHQYLGTKSGFYYYLSYARQDQSFPYGEMLYIIDLPKTSDLVYTPPVLWQAGNLVNYNQYYIAGDNVSTIYWDVYYYNNGELLVRHDGATRIHMQVLRSAVPNLTYYCEYIDVGFDSDLELISLVDVSTQEQYDVLIEGVWTDTNGYITTQDGVYPQVIDGDVIGGLADDVRGGEMTWQEAIGDMEDSYPENPAVPDIGLDLSTLDNLVDSLQLDRLETKFPFCIPNDLMLILNGATVVSSNAPVIEIPFRLEFNGHVYYNNDKAIVIDFNEFSGVVVIFREGFFLLFLIALLWVSIDILQAFFVVTE